MEHIVELTLHYLDGECYHAYKQYLTKRGTKWKDIRSKTGELQQVQLTFPKGTTYRELESSDEKYKRYQIIFVGGGIIYWSVNIQKNKNRIAVPYSETSTYGEK